MVKSDLVAEGIEFLELDYKLMPDHMSKVTPQLVVEPEDGDHHLIRGWSPAFRGMIRRLAGNG